MLQQKEINTSHSFQIFRKNMTRFSTMDSIFMKQETSAMPRIEFRIRRTYVQSPTRASNWTHRLRVQSP